MVHATRMLPTWLMLVLVALTAVLSPEAALAKKKTARKKHVRVVKQKKARLSQQRLSEGKEQALALIRNNSLDLSELAGLEPNKNAIADNTRPTTAQADDEIMEPSEGEVLSELEAEDDVTVDIDQFKNMWLSFVDADPADALTSSGIEKQKIMNQVMDWLGTTYHFGGSSRQGIDCSAFMQTIFVHAAEIQLPRTAAMQYEALSPVRREELEFGDLVFFNTRRGVYVSHVGIYLGDNLFAHASSRYGVTVSSLESTFYNNRFIGARRISPRAISRLATTADNNAH